MRRRFTRGFVGGQSDGGCGRMGKRWRWGTGRGGLVGMALGRAYADEGKLLEAWVQARGRGGVPADTLLVGDALYGYRAW
ncbi:MAG: hypothetical protein ACK4ME_06195 [Fimbriimonadales bacterium]